MSDARFSTEKYDFGYRIAGILVIEGKVLLQKPIDSHEFAVPGGTAKLGETSAETLKREFTEELGVGIDVGKLRWVEEVFWVWNGKPNHQISLYFDVCLLDAGQIPLSGMFAGKEPHLGFHWIDVEDLYKFDVYPAQMQSLLQNQGGAVEHWVHREVVAGCDEKL